MPYSDCEVMRSAVYTLHHRFKTWRGKPHHSAFSKRSVALVHHVPCLEIVQVFYQMLGEKIMKRVAWESETPTGIYVFSPCDGLNVNVEPTLFYASSATNVQPMGRSGCEIWMLRGFTLGVFAFLYQPVFVEYAPVCLHLVSRPLEVLCNRAMAVVAHRYIRIAEIVLFGYEGNEHLFVGKNA